MDIIYLGHSSFRLKGKSVALVTDPFDPEFVGIKYQKTEADIVTLSHHHKDHDRVDLVKNTIFTVDGAGEYEVRGVSMIGIPTYHDDQKGNLRGKNTLYVIEMDDLRIVHLGDLGHTLDEKEIEQLGDVDILLVPVGGTYTLGPKEAADVTRDIEARITIPMHYNIPGNTDFSKLSTVEDYLKEVGMEAERTDKLVVRKELINYDEMKVVVLTVR